MSEQVDILDFNEAHKNRNSAFSEQDRFSTKRVKQLLTLEDVDHWVEQIKMPQTRNYEYPSNLNKAIIHQQSCYIQPDVKFLKENPKLLLCDCCGQMIRRLRYNIFTCDMHDIFAGEYGTSIPIYFSILKLHFIILVIIGCIFGIYSSYLSDKYCKKLDLHNHYESELYEQYCGTFLAAQHFLLYNFAQQIKINNSYSDQYTYYILGYVAYLLMMLTPLMHEILLKVQQIKYWKYDSLNHIRIPKLTLYIKHIPKKFNEQEIKLYIQNAIASEHQHLKGQNFIEEIVYIYDTHPIKDLNDQRTQSYLKILQTVKELKENPRLELKSQLIDQVLLLLKQTRDIQKTLAHGMPFTQKVILKFNSESVTNLVFKYYDKSFFNNIKQQFVTIKESAQNYEEFQKDKIELQAKLLEQSQTNSEISSQIIENQDIQDLQEVVRSNSEILVQQTQNIKQKMKQSMIQFLSLPEPEEQQQETIEQSKVDDKKDLHLQRGFRQDDIFWEHIGMHTLKRFFLRLITTLITLFVGLMIMALFEILFLLVQHLKRQAGWVSTVIVIVMTLFTVALSVLSTVLVIVMTKRSKRSTYSLQEKNIITFMSPIQQVCILAFPFIFSLSILQQHSALNNIKVLLAVSQLAQVRLISKGLLHIFHLRSIRFNSQKKKITKNFNPELYFQKQLNQLLTPPLFPIRSRLFYALFVYSTGMITLFINPILVIWCLVIIIIMYFYDKYSVLNEYQCDKLFTFQLQKYLILTYQIIMIPVYCYIYIVTFTNVGENIGNNYSDLIGKLTAVSSLWAYLGYGTFFLSFVSFIFFRNNVANFFVYGIFRYRKPIRDSTIFIEKSYLQSYTEYFDNLGVSELNQILVDTFQNMQYKGK